MLYCLQLNAHVIEELATKQRSQKTPIARSLAAQPHLRLMQMSLHHSGLAGCRYQALLLALPQLVRWC